MVRWAIVDRNQSAEWNGGWRPRTHDTLPLGPVLASAMKNGDMANVTDLVADDLPVPTSMLLVSSLETPGTLSQTANGDLTDPVLLQVFGDIMSVKDRTNSGGRPKTDIPIARIRSMMKRDGEVAMLSSEAPIIMSKVSALFIADITFQAFSLAHRHQRPMIKKEDVLQIIKSSQKFDFLYDLIADPTASKSSV